MDEQEMPETREELDALIDERIEQALRQFVMAFAARIDAVPISRPQSP
jgi:hypothetical protein